MRQKTELSSWKEIANRLDVSVRTAQLWEKERGLPVRRLQGRRGRVFVCIDELEAWLLAENPSFPPERARPGARASGFIALGVVGILAVAVVVTAVVLASDDRRPVDTRVTDSALIVLDGTGAELWRAKFPEGLLADTYRVARFGPWIEDLDDDGSPEVLFVYAPAALDVSHVLICYSAAGEEMWRFDSTGSLATATEEFYPTYRISNVTVADLGDGRPSIVFTVHHYLQYPTRVVVMGADGAIRRDYWHAGHIGVGEGQLQLADLNGDGRLEIYASGVDNARDQATLVVLDPFAMDGAGVEGNPEYQFLGHGPGHELARVFFPRSSLSDYSYRYNVAQIITVHSDGLLIDVLESAGDVAAPTVMYELDRSLRVHKVIPSDTYIGAHRKLHEAHELSRSLAEEEQYLLEKFQSLRGPVGTDGRFP